MNWHDANLKVYDNNAEGLATYYRGFGPRSEDIQRGISLSKKGADSVVVEIGCGDGRDATEITKRVKSYIGVDPSEGLLSVARNDLPEASFVLADALSYDYPQNIDIIFAFASLLHVNKDDLSLVFKKIHTSLNPEGILYIALKESSAYKEEIKSDAYGQRMFYYYNPEIIREMAGDGFEVVYEDHQVAAGDTRWFTMGMRKKS